MTPTPHAPSPDLRWLPLSSEGVEAAFAIDPTPWPLPLGEVARWGGEASPFLGQGPASWVVVPGRAALLVGVNPRAAGGPLGMFGWLRLAPDVAGPERTAVVAALIAAARDFTRRHGATRLRGPMTFSTWLPYRVLAEDSPAGEAGFPGEGVEPAARNALYTDAGLVVTDRYLTQAVPDDPDYWEVELAREAALASRRGGGLHVRAVEAGEGPTLLPRIHTWLNATFAGAPYFTPIGPAELAERIVGRAPADVEAVHLVALDGTGDPQGVLVGFLHGDRGILKTVAVSPAVRGGRAAMALTFGFHRWVRSRGTTCAWHAQMHEGGISRRMSAKHARPVRRYVLYGDAHH
ncbi:MAG: GNAT family N-acetyltransferase [Candidatus Sericytochromatia bacterium]|nr:GNAT family N-acetyltransferase [Candidatus Sericytochromatia bacterium]